MTIQELMNLRAPKLTEEQIYSVLGLGGPANQHDDVARRLVEVVHEAIQKAYALGQNSIRDAAVDAFLGLGLTEEEELLRKFLTHWKEMDGILAPTYDDVDGWSTGTDVTTIVWSVLCELGIAEDPQED